MSSCAILLVVHSCFRTIVILTSPDCCRTFLITVFLPLPPSPPPLYLSLFNDMYMSLQVIHSTGDQLYMTLLTYDWLLTDEEAESVMNIMSDTSW